MQSLRCLMARWRLWLAVRWQGHWRVPSGHRRWLRCHERQWQRWISQHFGGARWRTRRMRGAAVQPFVDLLNRPAGGEAYCGGVLFTDLQRQPELRHFRGHRAIDLPLSDWADPKRTVSSHNGRLFWCGPLAFHFGHQIADFGSRVLLASVDPREGDLLWLPWRAASSWQELLPWQRSLLSYLNPGGKQHRITTEPLRVRELVVPPQQARMQAAPTLAHLEALGWCERAISPQAGDVVYVSRTRFAACRSAATLMGAFAGEVLLEQLLQERGVRVVHPETLALEEQLAIYLGAEALIVAEGSAQHCLELLGFHPHKPVVVICRREQLPGMELPLLARFPRVHFVEALHQQWVARDGVAWNGLSLLDWHRVVAALNPLLPQPLAVAECAALHRASEDQLRVLAAQVPLQTG
jgi:hypothetical protein